VRTQEAQVPALGHGRWRVHAGGDERQDLALPDLGLRLRLEGVAQAQGEGEHVGLRPHPRLAVPVEEAGGHLGREVQRRSAEVVAGTVVRRHPEVEEHGEGDLPLREPREHHVLRLDVLVPDAGPVQRRQRLRQLPEDRLGLVPR
jgi:hypothetical protein